MSGYFKARDPGGGVEILVEYLLRGGLEHLLEELLLPGEVIVDSRAVGAETCRDVAERRGFVTLFLEHFAGYLQQLVPLRPVGRAAFDLSALPPPGQTAPASGFRR